MMNYLLIRLNSFRYCHRHMHLMMNLQSLSCYYMIYPNKMSYCLMNCFLMSCFLMMYIRLNMAYASNSNCCFGSVHYYIPALCILVYSLP